MLRASFGFFVLQMGNRWFYESFSVYSPEVLVEEGACCSVGELRCVGPFFATICSD